MSVSPARYAELHALSAFSFRRSAAQPGDLVRRAAALGYRALAITDECSMAGVVRAHEAAEECGLALIIGTEVCLEDLHLVLLAPDQVAYSQLCRLITRARRRAVKGGYRIEAQDLSEGLDHVLAIWKPAPWTTADGKPPHAWAERLKQSFSQRLWLGATRLLQPGEQAWFGELARFAHRHQLPILACGDVRMSEREQRPLLDVLSALHENQPLAECGLVLAANGERHLRPISTLIRLYPPEWLAETVRVAEKCCFSLGQLNYQYPRELVPKPLTPAQHLRQLTLVGLRERYGEQAPDAVRRQIAHELKLIEEMGVEAFFLTVHDVVRFARSRGILCQGRGSAANSAVCYCLKITEVDPSKQQLLFERFISKERNEPPDIDVDFEHERREEVLQYLYDKYGRERAALAATVIRYQPKSALKDVGRALGLEPERLNRLSASLAWWDQPETWPERLSACGFDPEAPVTGQLMRLTTDLIGLPRHLSQHVGGMVISDAPLHHLVPVENAAMADRTIIQWDKDDLETLGLLKVDCLALGMLTVIRKTLALVGEGSGTRSARDQGPGNRDQGFQGLATREQGPVEEGCKGLGARGQGSGSIGEGFKSTETAEALQAVGRGYTPDGRCQGQAPDVGHVRPTYEVVAAEIQEPVGRGYTPDGSYRDPAPDVGRGRPTYSAAQPETRAHGQIRPPAPNHPDPCPLAPAPSSGPWSLVPGPSNHPGSLAEIPREDPATYAMLSRGDAVGVFQVESRAQMAMLPRLKPRCFYDLVVEVAIVRPGPIQGEMVHPYLTRRDNPAEVRYPSPELKGVLERTLGVPIFQEQVMQIAMTAAGFTPGQADQLRRAMAAWKRRGGLEPFREQLVEGMLARGYTLEFAERIYSQIKGFGDYGFPESHAASFALLTYFSAWLKCHHPAAFACGLLNSQPMGFYAPAQIINDVRRHGVQVRPVDVRFSGWDCGLEALRDQGSGVRGQGDWVPASGPGCRPCKTDLPGGTSEDSRTCRSGLHPRRPMPESGSSHQPCKADRRNGHLDPVIRLGLRMVKGLKFDSAERIVATRTERSFQDVQDLAVRARLDRGQLKALAEAGALKGLAGHRRRARWEALAVQRQGDLLDSAPIAETRTPMRPPDSLSEMLDDYASTGLSLDHHPAALLRRALGKRIRTARTLAETADGTPVEACGLVTHRQRPGTASGVIFLSLEDETGIINVIVWPKLAERYRQAVLQAQLLRVVGTLQNAEGSQHLIAKSLHSEDQRLAGLRATSRDFC
ncbi:MAG: helix-hairpin-helix domain-containing protein [Wenzhouxiangella sp.]